MSEKIRVNLLSFISLLVIYGIAFGLDRWTEYTQMLAGKYAIPTPALWAWSVSNIILALLVFLYYQWAMPHIYPWMTWVIVILGILIDFLPVLSWTIPFFPLRPYVLSGGRGYFLLIGALTAIGGVVTLFRTRQN